MLKASEVKNLIPEKGTLVLSFRTAEEGRLSVIVHPKYPEAKIENLSSAKDAIEKAKTPVVITATPEDLDERFMEILSQTVSKRQSLEEALKSLDANVQEALKQAKASADKRMEAAKKTSKPGVKASSSDTDTEKPVDDGGTAEKKEEAGTLSLFA
ncbi:MAG: PRTRC system protein E [Candidatus Uhrbacteria bacterium]|nr:PRTRC system protein E [Candidatus Uhrbacteria bacterium]